MNELTLEIVQDVPVRLLPKTKKREHITTI